MIRTLCLAAAASVLLAGCASDSPISQGGFSNLGAVQPANLAVTPEYKIGPLDKLSILVFRNQDFSQPTVQVDANGQLLLPMIGPISASGKTTGELSTEITAKLSDCCLNNPNVTVLVTDAVSQQITVTGAVTTSGVYVLRGRTTLLQAVSMAGGPDKSTADTRRIAVYRVVDGNRMGALFDLNAIRAGKAEDPPIYAGDTIIVDTSASKSAWRNITGAIPLFTIFRPF
jgi:polysaccharide export outer membrane protein